MLDHIVLKTEWRMIFTTVHILSLYLRTKLRTFHGRAQKVLIHKALLHLGRYQLIGRDADSVMLMTM